MIIIGIIFRWIKRLVILFFALSLIGVLLFRFIPVPFTPFMVVKTIEQVSDGKGFRWHKEWVPLSQISKHVPKAMLAAEDQNFINHNGFDFEAIKKAYKNNEKGRRIKGASTISQQTAKNVFLWPGRTWIRKGLEAWFTMLIELFWSKERIMEVYVNVIEMGQGVYGIEAAAKEYYNKSSADLSKGEAAMIASILPNPVLYSPLHPDPKIYRKQKRVLLNMSKIKGIDWGK
jgi:monofunctional biosynthetic peptidoglycan transglycosylase